MLHGMNDQVLRNGAFGLAAGVILFALRVSVDENYRLQAIRTYMVDYLDNFCARKYEKSREKSMPKYEEESVPKIMPEEKQEMKQEPVPELMPENIPVKEPPRESIRETIREAEKIPEREAEKVPKREAEKVSARELAREPVTKPASARQDKNVSKEVLIREILEEYLA